MGEVNLDDLKEKRDEKLKTLLNIEKTVKELIAMHNEGVDEEAAEATEEMVKNEREKIKCLRRDINAISGPKPQLYEWGIAVVSSLLFMFDIYSDLNLGIFYLTSNNKNWATYTLLFFFIPWFYQFLYGMTWVCRLENRSRRIIGIFMCVLGLHVVHAKFDELARKHGFYDNEECDSELEKSSYFSNMMIVVLEDLPQIMIQVYVVGWMNRIEANAFVAIITSFLSVFGNTVRLHITKPEIEPPPPSPYPWVRKINNFLSEEADDRRNRWIRRQYCFACPSSFAEFREKPAVRYMTGIPHGILHYLPIMLSSCLFISVHQIHGCWAIVLWYVLTGMVLKRLKRHKGEEISCLSLAQVIRFLLNILTCIIINFLLSAWFVAMASAVAATGNNPNITSSSSIPIVPSFIWPNTSSYLEGWKYNYSANATLPSWANCNTTAITGIGELSNELLVSLEWCTRNIWYYPICITDIFVEIYQTAFICSLIYPLYVVAVTPFLD